MPNLDLDNLLEEDQAEDQEQKNETDESQEQEKQDQKGQQEGGEDKGQEKDEFEGLEENKDFFTLNDGRRVKRQELIDGYMREDNYHAKTQEIAEMRKQLEIANVTPKAPEETKAAKIDLQEQNKAIDKALADMDDEDPMALTLKGIFDQNKQIINFINNQQQAVYDQEKLSQAEKDAKFAEKLINDSLNKEAKNYKLPTFKLEDGQSINFRSEWDNRVLAKLQTITEDLTLAQYNHRVNQIGKEVYQQLRTLISVTSAGKPKNAEGSDGSQTSYTGTKKAKSSETDINAGDNKTGKRKMLSLSERLCNAADARFGGS